VSRLIDAASACLPSYLDRLRTLVGIDSGTRDVAGLAQVARAVEGWASAAGLSARRIAVHDPGGASLGEAVVATVHGAGARRILLAGHLDTVFPAGSAAARPFRRDGDILYGPGVCDDKGGLLAGLAAIETLRALDLDNFGRLTLVCTPDEEIGAIGSRGLLEKLAAQSDVALCLECARENGDLVSARKGVADVEITLHGRAAHAGIEPERGANAAVAAARLVVALQRLNRKWPDVTVNVGMIQAGDRPNVVPDQARLLLDLRAATGAGFAQALAAVQELADVEHVPGVSATVSVHAPIPPWEPSPATARLAELAQEVGTQVGVEVRHAATGGCADANLFAAAGVPVLDGLGPIGGGDHSPQEWLDLASVAPRVALLAGLIDRVSRD
jgi:glutamate carboxypeptidase